MKLLRIGFCTLALLLMTVPLVAQDWTGTYRVHGRVTDEAGEPIEGATIKVWLGDENRGPEPMLTKKNGRWAFGGLRYGVWTVSIEKDGKMPSQGQVQVSSQTKPVNVTLRDIPEELLYNERALAAKKLLEEGNALLEAGDTAAARAKYEQGMIDLDAEYHADILLAIAMSYSREDNGQSALETLEKANAQSPGNPKVLLALARAHYELGDAEKAITGLQELLAVDPDNEMALRVVSDMLAAQGRVDEAQQYIARLPEGTKLDPNALLNVGIDAYNAGEMETAFEQFNAVVEQYPEMSQALYYRGLLFLSKGENDAAAADLKKFLELEPDSDKVAEVKEFLSYLEPQ